MGNKGAKLLRNFKKKKKNPLNASARMKRDVACQPSLKVPPPAPRLPNSSAPEDQASSRSRLPSLRNRSSTTVIVEQQGSPEFKQTQKQGQQRRALPQLPPPFTPLQESLAKVPPTTDSKLRNLPHRREGQPPSAYKHNLNTPKNQGPERELEEAAPPRRQLPPGTVCKSKHLSFKDLKTNQELAMPVALRRPSTPRRRRLSEKENTRPNGSIMTGFPDGISSHKKANALAHAHNQALTNGDLPSSTHSHPSQTHAPPAVPSRTEEKDREKALERNIDTVVFGDRMFRAWYPSWYPKEIIGEKALSDAKAVGIVVQTLYVCSRCFGYGKEVHEWAKHCQSCLKEVPGARVYLHGAGEGKSEEECVWSVWEVDGGVDTVSCFPYNIQDSVIKRSDY